MTLKLNFFNHFAALFSLLIVTVLMITCLIWLNFDRDIVLIFSIFYLLDALPALYLHVEYYLRNRGESYEISKNELVRYKNGEQTYYNISDIDNIIVYMSPSVYQGSNLHFLALETYHFARVKMKNGEEIILTCLLTPKVEIAIRKLTDIPYERKKALFSTLKWV